MSVLLAVALISISRYPAFTAACATALLVLLATQPARIIARVLGGAIAASAFACLVLLPSMLLGNVGNALLLCAKTFCTVALVTTLAAWTRWESLFEALSLFRVPDLLILILDITLKYIVLLGEHAFSLLEALKLRSVGRNRDKRRSLSGVAGALFLRSTEAARTLHQAMECRAFTGSYAARRKIRFTFEALFLAIADTALVLLFFFLEHR